MKAYFISDVHLKCETKTKGQKIISFLESLPQDTTHLILLGDIFDLWVGDHAYFYKKFSKIITLLQRLKARGIEIHYFEGNHDLHLTQFWQNKLGIQVHRDTYFFEWPGITVRAEHGDLMNPNDKGYLFLRKFLRTKSMEFVAHHLPGALVGFIGDRSSQMSRVYTDRMNQKYKETVTALTHTYAKKVYPEKHFDLFVTGHTHVDDDFTFESGTKKIRSINLGSWLDQPKALEVTPQEQKILLL